jgi:hypothetical protein
MMARKKNQFLTRFFNSNRPLAALLLGGSMLLATGCPTAKPQECVDKSAKPLEECRVSVDKLQAEILTLKRQLAQALADPGSIKVDPEVLKINGKYIKPVYKEGTLSQEEVVSTMSKNKKVLKSCYERAMKKSVALQRDKITLTIGFKVQPNGTAASIRITPNYDSTMVDCMKKAIRRWKFPKFTGQAVGVESPLTLSPKR